MLIYQHRSGKYNEDVHYLYPKQYVQFGQYKISYMHMEPDMPGNS